MGLLDHGAAKALRETMSRYRDDVDVLDAKVERLSEAGVGLAALAAEDVGWRLLAGGQTVPNELDLGDIKTHSESARTLRAANPLVKRGIIVRNAYIWAQAINYPDSAKTIIDDPVNQQSLFSNDAEEELEAAFNTDGQYFLLLDPRKKQARRLPFDEITGVVTNPEFRDDIWYYKRSYSVEVTDDQGNTTRTPRDVYIPSINYSGETRSFIGEVPVDNTKRVEHAAVNRQVGWRFGLPDVLGAVYWAKAYKEYLEASYTLSKALARIAFKVTSQSGKGQKQVAAKMATPYTTEQAGGVAALGLGQDLVALNKSGSGVDFKGGSPLAAMVAASLDVPLSVLLTDGSAGGRQGAENALEAPTLKTMDLRRRAHLASRTRVLRYFGITEEPTWPRVSDDPIHRVLQAIVQGKATGALHPEEVRALVVQALNVISDRAVDDIPEDYNKQPETTGPGALSDGTNDSRDTPGGATDA